MLYNYQVLYLLESWYIHLSRRKKLNLSISIQLDYFQLAYHIIYCNLGI